MWRAVVADARALNVLDLQIFCEFIVLMMGHNDFKFLTLNFVRSVSNIPSVIAQSFPYSLFRRVPNAAASTIAKVFMWSR